MSVPTAPTPPSQFVQHTGARSENIHTALLSNFKTCSGVFRPQLLHGHWTVKIYCCRPPW